MDAPKNSNNTRRFSSRSASENLAPANMYSGIFPFPPPSISFSYPPSASVRNLSHPRHQRQNPPLLPLPLPISRSSSSLSSRSSSTSRKNNNINRARDQAVTPKKPKSKKVAKPKSESLVVASTNRLGPEPNDLPKDVGPKVIVSSASLGPGCVVAGDLDELPGGSVFILAPPPSSLPLPSFSIMRPSKLSCNAEAAGVDDGATDNLRRLLRLP